MEYSSFSGTVGRANSSDIHEERTIEVSLESPTKDSAVNKRPALEECSISPTSDYKVKVKKPPTWDLEFGLSLRLLAQWRDGSPVDLPGQLYTERVYAKSLPAILAEHMYFIQNPETVM